MITFSIISKIFLDFLGNIKKEFVYNDELQNLVYLNIKTNRVLWELEDSARLSELGDKHIAEVKKSIDITNQSRNNLIKEIDTILYEDLNIISSSPDNFYSESPGMIIDRLSIIFIKRLIVQGLILHIKEDTLRHEYIDKEKILADQIKNLGQFLDMYMSKLINKEVFFEIQQPVKIYNDARIKKYIKVL